MTDEPTDETEAVEEEAEDERPGVVELVKESLSEKPGVVESARERVPARPSMAEHDSTVVAAVDELRDATVSVVAGTALGVARVVPFSERFFYGLYGAGLKGIYKKSGCDYIGMVQVGGEIKPVPVNFDYEKNRFENRHGDWWKAPTEGEYRYRMAGKVPAVWASSTSNHVGSHLQAEVAEALDMGREKDLYESAQVTVENATISANGAGQARADGGQSISNFNVSGSQPGMFKDRVVPLTPSDDADARVVSLDKYYETYPEVVDSEEMQAQEERGRLSANNRDYGKFALKMMLIAAAIVAVVVLGPPLLSGLFGGGGGGGGGGGANILPAMIGLV